MVFPHPRKPVSRETSRNLSPDAPKPGSLALRVRPSSPHKIGVFKKDTNYEFTIFEWRKNADGEFGWWVYYAPGIFDIIEDAAFRDYIKGEELATRLGMERLQRAINARDNNKTFEQNQEENTKWFGEDDAAKWQWKVG